jgi:hypothetical protein
MLLADSFQSPCFLVLNLPACCCCPSRAPPSSQFAITVLDLVHIVDDHSLLSTAYLCRGPPCFYSRSLQNKRTPRMLVHELYFTGKTCPKHSPAVSTPRVISKIPLESTLFYIFPSKYTAVSLKLTCVAVGFPYLLSGCRVD